MEIEEVSQPEEHANSDTPMNISDDTPSLAPQYVFAAPAYEPQTLGLVGLNNLGNTCYMNSAL